MKLRWYNHADSRHFNFQTEQTRAETETKRNHLENLPVEIHKIRLRIISFNDKQYFRARLYQKVQWITNQNIRARHTFIQIVIS